MRTTVEFVVTIVYINEYLTMSIASFGNSQGPRLHHRCMVVRRTCRSTIGGGPESRRHEVD